MGQKARDMGQRYFNPKLEDKQRHTLNLYCKIFIDG